MSSRRRRSTTKARHARERHLCTCPVGVCRVLVAAGSVSDHRRCGRCAPDRRGGAAADRREVAALRRAAAGVRRQGQDHRQALDVRAARLARAEQGGAALHRAGRGQGRGAAGREPSRPRVGSVDVDAGDRARSADRAAGSLDAVLRHRFQLRGSRRARRRPVRLHAARRGGRRRRAVLEDPVDAEAEQVVAVHAVDGLDPQGQLHASRGSRTSSRTRWCGG